VAKSAAAAAVFVANFRFQAQTGGYWGTDAGSMPLLHLWSLSVEEQFYLVWPALLMLVPRAKLVPALIVTMLLSLACAEWWLWSNPTAAFFQTPARFWELAAGGLVATLPVRALPAWLGRGALALTLGACLVPLSHFPGLGALPAVLGTAALLASIHGGARNAFLASRPLVGIGLVSYSFYLWHWPLLVFGRLMHIGPVPLPVRLALVAAAFVLACATYRYIEQPFRRYHAPSRRLLAGGFGAMAVLALASISYRAPEAVEVWADYPIACHARKPGEPVPMQYFSCLGREPKVVIWGDSQAHAWTAMAQALAEKLDLPATTLARDGCPPLIGADLPLRSPMEAKKCAEWNHEAIAYLRTHGADTLIIVARWDRFINGRPNGAAESLARTVHDVSPHVRRILIIGPTPTLADDLDKCRSLGSDCGVSRARNDALVAPAHAAMARLDDPKVTLTQPEDWLCSSTYCPGVREGVVLYLDQAHVAPVTARAWSKRVASGWQ
jgi:hypothetical protein